MSENVIILLPAAVDLERIFSRLPATYDPPFDPPAATRGQPCCEKCAGGFQITEIDGPFGVARRTRSKRRLS